MSKGGKILLGIGFFFSFLSLSFMITIVLAIFALVTYPLGSLCRSIGWILFGRNRKIQYVATGISILILFPVVIIGILQSDFLIETFGLTVGQSIAISLVAWSFYSIIELSSYYSLAKADNKLFYGAMISTVGIIIVLGNIGNVLQSTNPLDSLGAVYYALYFLIVSSLLAMVGSFKSKEE